MTLINHVQKIDKCNQTFFFFKKKRKVIDQPYIESHSGKGLGFWG